MKALYEASQKWPNHFTLLYWRVVVGFREQKKPLGSNWAGGPANHLLGIASTEQIDNHKSGSLPKTLASVDVWHLLFLARTT